MHGSGEHEGLRRTEPENGREAVADEHREPMPYVARDLSWALVRYLDTQGS